MPVTPSHSTGGFYRRRCFGGSVCLRLLWVGRLAKRRAQLFKVFTRQPRGCGFERRRDGGEECGEHTHSATRLYPDGTHFCTGNPRKQVGGMPHTPTSVSQASSSGFGIHFGALARGALRRSGQSAVILEGRWCRLQSLVRQPRMQAQSRASRPHCCGILAGLPHWSRTRACGCRRALPPAPRGWNQPSRRRSSPQKILRFRRRRSVRRTNPILACTAAENSGS